MKELIKGKLYEHQIKAVNFALDLFSAKKGGDDVHFHSKGVALPMEMG